MIRRPAGRCRIDQRGPLSWLPVSRFLPRAAGWSAATLCVDSKQPSSHCGNGHRVPVGLPLG
jgi:hypothetical protein